MPSRRKIGAILVFMLLSIGWTSSADDQSKDLVKPTLLADTDAISPSTSFTLAIQFTIKPPWHIYWKNPGEAGDATRVKLSGPAGLTFGPVQFPLPTKLEADGGVTYVYEKEVLLLVPVTVSKDLAIGGDAVIRAQLSWQSCHDTCVDGEAKVSLTLPIRDGAAAINRELFETWRQRLPLPQSDAIAKVQQDGEQPILSVDWKHPPAGKADWYPISTPAVAIENVAVEHKGTRTTIRFKPTVYKLNEALNGRVEGVLIYEDASGHRHGVELPVRVKN